MIVVGHGLSGLDDGVEAVLAVAEVSGGVELDGLAVEGPPAGEHVACVGLDQWFAQVAVVGVPREPGLGGGGGDVEDLDAGGVGSLLGHGFLGRWVSTCGAAPADRRRAAGWVSSGRGWVVHVCVTSLRTVVLLTRPLFLNSSGLLRMRSR
ncbi:MAG: hypothetical protein CMJ44_12155 [Pimelobacter sp.]|nr:hypothetical protein [Pimelobacter sp.]